MMPRPALVLAAIVLVLDQATKWWILSLVMQPPRSIAVTPFFNLVLVWNRGVTFGLFDGNSQIGPWLLVALSLAIVAGLVVWLRRVEGVWPVYAIGLIIGGAIGNAVDRLRLGAVVDFLDLYAAGYHWPAFNLADSAIVVGVAVLIIDGLFDRNKAIE